MPERIQLRRTKGWRKPEGAIVVARPTKWGNPFSVFEYGEIAVIMFENLLAWGDEGGFHPYPEPGQLQRLSDHRERILTDIEELRGRDLACWCSLDQPCHADVLLEIANAE